MEIFVVKENICYILKMNMISKCYELAYGSTREQRKYRRPDEKKKEKGKQELLRWKIFVLLIYWFKAEYLYVGEGSDLEDMVSR